MITVISKHLPLIENSLVSRDQILQNIHYVETLRYGIGALRNLSHREIDMPKSFEPGIRVTKKEVRHLYRFMAMWFEIENTVRTSRSFLDFFWRTVVSNSPVLSEIAEVRNQKYMSSAVNYLRKSGETSVTYKLIENEWDSWGKYMMDFRKYIEYTEPLGGLLSQSVGRLSQVGNELHIFLPDRFPVHREDPRSFQFTYTSQRFAVPFLESMIHRIDVMFPAVISEIHTQMLDGNSAKHT